MRPFESPSPAISDSGSSGSLPPSPGSAASTSSRSDHATQAQANAASRARAHVHTHASANASASPSFGIHSKPVLLGRPIVRSSAYTPNAPQLSSSIDRQSLPIASDSESMHDLCEDNFTQLKRLPKRYRCCCFYASLTVRLVVWIVCVLLALALGITLFFAWPRTPSVALKSIVPLADRNYPSISNRSINYFMEAEFEISSANYFPYVIKTLTVESFVAASTNGSLYKATVGNIRLAARGSGKDTLRVIFDFSYGNKPVEFSQSLVLFYQQCYESQSVRLAFHLHFNYRWTSWTGHLFSTALSKKVSCSMALFAPVIKRQFPQLVPDAARGLSPSSSRPSV